MSMGSKSCVGELCPTIGICGQNLEDIGGRMWETIPTVEDSMLDCNDLGDKIQKVAPRILEQANHCATMALGNLMPGATNNPIKALRNRYILHKLGIITMPEDKIIH